jgi:folate-binding protein YgfZ
VTSTLLELPGAIPPPDDSPDPGVAWHYGDPFGEQRVATRGVAVVDRSHRELLAVPGTDRLSWLHLLTSQHFTDLAEDLGTEGLVLDAHGRVEYHVVAANTGGTVWLDTERGYARPLLEYLRSMVFWSNVEPREATEELAVLSVLGPELATVLGPITLPEQAYGVVALPGGGFLRRMPWPGRHAVDLLVPRESVLDWWRKLTDAGARPAGSWAFEALRVESLRPRLGLDNDDKTLPHELNWVPSAVHLEKGCYRGQETVSKIQNIGRSPRRMVLLHLDGSPEIYPKAGDPVQHGEKVVGRVGTVAQHHELGPIALALLKRSAPLDAELMVGSGEEIVQAAVDPDSIPPDPPAPGRAAAKGLRDG